MAGTEYDLIVIGAGPVGENVADRAVQGGLSVAIVEGELVGGECSYWACMPSKALLRPGSARRAALAAPGAKQSVTGDLDVAAVLANRTAFTSGWDDSGQVSWLQGAGIDLHRGDGRITGVRTVEVNDGGQRTTLTARHAVAIATGTTATVPDTPGLRAARPWTSREATSATAVPARLAIIGGGVVAAEMATAYSDLGSDVTMVIRSDLLPTVERFAADLVGKALTSRGVTLLSGTRATRVDRRDDGSVRLELAGIDGTEGAVGADAGSSDRELIVDEVLVATGRTPASTGIGLEAVGLPDGGWLTTDDTLRVLDSDGELLDGGWLYAVGDVNHRALLTHQGKYQARAAGDVIAARAAGDPVDDQPWGAHVATADHAAVPQVVFTDPEIAAVGLSADAAGKSGIAARTVEIDLGGVAGASLHAEGYTGRAQLVIDTDAEVIVGATFVGPDVAELVHAATIAIVGQVPIDRLWHAVPAYPTISEAWLRLLEAYRGP